MSKITVRADDDLVERLDALEASKSQVVREALRAYLDGDEGEASIGSDAGEDEASSGERSLDDLVTERVDELVEARLDEAVGSRVPASRGQPQDVNVNVTVESPVSDGTGEAVSNAAGETVSDEAAAEDGGGASTNDGVEESRPERVGSAESACAQCGSDVSAEHVYCPNCGEKATRRALCECGEEVRSDWAFCPGCGRRTPAADVLDSG